MTRVTTTLIAARQLQEIPGLRAKVVPILEGVLETAIEARKLLHSGLLPLDPPIAVHVDGHTIWYALDLDREMASILGVELEGRRTEKPDPVEPGARAT